METPLTERIELDEPPPDLSEYEETGGYAAVRKALGEMIPSEVAGEVPDYRPASNGVSCRWARRRRTRNTSSATPTRWSPGPSRTGI